jgi:hypothetical protein
MMSDQLADTLAAFDAWRNSKPTKSNATPVTLRQQAVALFPHYSKSIIAKALRISGGQFKRWQLECQPLPHTSAFISLPSPPNIALSQSLSLEVNFANGHQLLFAGDLNIEQILPLLEAIKS